MESSQKKTREREILVTVDFEIQKEKELIVREKKKVSFPQNQKKTQHRVLWL